MINRPRALEQELACKRTRNFRQSGMLEIHGTDTSAASSQLKQRLADCWRAALADATSAAWSVPADATMWSSVEQRAKQIQTDHLVIVGIGGSNLGTRAIVDGLRSKVRATVTFLEEPDPTVLESLKFSPNCHFLFVSKSGNTLETLSWIEWLNHKFPAFLTAEHCTVIASPYQGPLQTWAAEKNIPVLQIPHKVGGRFSVLTPVGMFPAALMGLDVSEFRKGAQEALERPEFATNISAFVIESWKREAWITQLWTYSAPLATFGAWWQQLWGESLGKKLNRSGAPAPRASTPMTCSGPRDQHSLMQQLCEGAADKAVISVRVRLVENDHNKFTPQLFAKMPGYGRPLSLGEVLASEAEAFSRNMEENKIPCLTLSLNDLSERSLGSFFMLWQMVTAQLGEYLDINTFDQPGVERGKILAAQILKG